MKILIVQILLFPILSLAQTKISNLENDRKNETYSGYSKSWQARQSIPYDTTKTYYFPSGKVKARGDRLNGEWIEFFETGSIKIKQTFSNGKSYGDTYCYLENGSLLLPRYLPQRVEKNNSIINNSTINVYKLFDSQDSINEVLDLETYISDSILICDNGILTILIGAIKFEIKPSSLGVHVCLNTICMANIIVQHFVSNPSTPKNEKKYFKTQLGEIEVERKQTQCEKTGNHAVKITKNKKSVYFKDIGNLIFFEYDVDKGGSKELFIVNYYPCKGEVEIYKLDE